MFLSSMALACYKSIFYAPGSLNPWTLRLVMLSDAPWSTFQNLGRTLGIAVLPTKRFVSQTNLDDGTGAPSHSRQPAYQPASQPGK